MGWFKWLLLLLIIAIAFLVWYCRPRPPVATTRLELESYGGFAYVHTPSEHKVEIAFLEDANIQELDPATNQQRPVCVVDQLGVDLVVVSGVIESTPVPENRMFDLAGATVTFPDLEAHATALTVNRGTRPAAAPFGPVNPSDLSQWADVKWVPGTTYGQSTSDYPASSLNPNWRSMVDGLVRLTHGEITATNPSDVGVKDSIFEFKSSGGTKTPYKQAMTDRTYFRADVPSDRIVIHLTGATNTPSQIIIRPVAPGRPVKLKLIGRHVHQTPPVLPVNAAVEHYCAFYQLLQPVPPARDQLIPYLFSGPPVASATSGQPSPGPLCPPDWF